jgi:hypothetical protein
MGASYEQRTEARKEADLMAIDLQRAAGILEEVATLWRRAELYGHQPSSSAPASLQDAARSLADAVRALTDAGSEDHPALAFSAVVQLAALQSNAALSAAVTGGHLGDAEMWAAIQDILLQAGNHLWSLISHLAKTGEMPLAEDLTARRVAPETRGRPPQPAPPTATPGESQRALAVQRDAIDALPEADVRRLLVLIGGMDPAALHRAATTYTETFCTVAEMKASVAALQPVALIVPPHYLEDS